MKFILFLLRKWFRYFYQRYRIGYVVYDVDGITAGKRHAWLNTSIGRMRKPLGTFQTINN